MQPYKLMVRQIDNPNNDQKNAPNITMTIFFFLNAFFLIPNCF
jgi:hypothetical protein